MKLNNIYIIINKSIKIDIFFINSLKFFTIIFSLVIAIIIYKNILKLKFFNSKGSNTKSKNFDIKKKKINSNSSSLPNPNSNDNDKEKKKKKEKSQKKLRKRDILKGIAFGVIVGIIIYFFFIGGGDNGGSDAINHINDNTTTTTISKALTIEKKVETVSAVAVATKAAHNVINGLNDGSGSAEYVSELARSPGAPANTELFSTAISSHPEAIFKLPDVTRYHPLKFKGNFDIIYQLELERLNKIFDNILTFKLTEEEKIQVLVEDLYNYKLKYYQLTSNISNDVYMAYIAALSDICGDKELIESIKTLAYDKFFTCNIDYFYNLLNEKINHINYPEESFEFKEELRKILSLYYREHKEDLDEDIITDEYFKSLEYTVKKICIERIDINFFNEVYTQALNYK